MSTLSRREFSTLVLAGVPLASLARPIRPATLSPLSPLTLGVATSSFRDFERETGRDNVDDVIRALRAVGATHIELALANVEPAPPSTAPRMGGSLAYPQLIVLTPQQIAAANAAARLALRQWRVDTDPALLKDVRRKFAAAAITVHAAMLDYDESSTDEEIDATFQQAAALGVTTLSSAMTMKTAKRLAPFAERHRVTVAIHNQVDGNAANAIATGTLNDALALSSAFKLKLDIGNLTASNCDAVVELRDRLARVSHVLVRDRLRNGGTSQHFGEGDTPIAGVLELLEKSAPAVPAFVEYDYVGVGTPVDEVRSAMAYLTKNAG